MICFAIGQIMVLASIVFVFDRKNKYEIILRAISVVCGVLIYSIARAVRLSFLNLILSMTSGLTAEYNVYFYGLALLFSFIVGIVLSSSVSRYIINHARIEETGDRAISTRLMCLGITLIFLLYCDLYMSFDIKVEENVHTLKPLLPNMIFILAILLFAVFRLRPSKTATTIPVRPPDEQENRSLQPVDEVGFVDSA